MSVRNKEHGTRNEEGFGRAGLGLLLIAVALLSVALSVGAANAEDPVVADLVVDQPPTLTVGDHVNYRLIVEVDKGTGVALAPNALPQEVALIDTPQESRRDLDNGREEVALTFRVAPFATGEITVPSLPVRYTTPDGQGAVVEAPGSVLRVTSVLPPSGEIFPRDLKPQAEIGNAPATYPWTLIGALVAAFVLVVIAALVRRRMLNRPKRVPEFVPEVLGPEDIARGILNKAGAAFQTSHDFDAYYTTLGNTMRYYLTQRHGFPAFALTTRELEAEMLAQELDRWQVRVTSGLLAQCDSVVYAQYRPALERADADLTAAFEIVEMSRPEERPMPHQEEAPAS
jgi:hypothetical protein